MSENQQDIANKFYSAFTSKNVVELEKFYHDDLKFEDPAFGILNKKETVAMWTMLFESGSDLTVHYEVLEESESSATVEWRASYSFGKNKRKVKNVITANLHFAAGQIIEHKDVFDLHRWAKQALGFSGLLLGWTTYFKKKLNAQTKARLIKYMAKN